MKKSFFCTYISSPESFNLLENISGRVWIRHTFGPVTESLRVGDSSGAPASSLSEFLCQVHLEILSIRQADGANIRLSIIDLQFYIDKNNYRM